MGETIHQGGCGCGHVRFEAQGHPVFVNNCHCTQCQHQTGSTSVVNAFYEAERVTLTHGSLSEHTVRAGSGGPHVICRCKECGTALWSFYPRLGRLGLGLRVGTLDDSAALTPDAVIFVSEKMPWVALPDGIPHFDTTYDYREVLPPERIERMNALIALGKAGKG